MKRNEGMEVWPAMPSLLVLRKAQTRCRSIVTDQAAWHPVPALLQRAFARQPWARLASHLAQASIPQAWCRRALSHLASVRQLSHRQASRQWEPLAQAE